MHYLFSILLLVYHCCPSTAAAFFVPQRHNSVGVASSIGGFNRGLFSSDTNFGNKRRRTTKRQKRPSPGLQFPRSRRRTYCLLQALMNGDTESSIHGQELEKKTTVIAGGTGYIGKSVVRESVRRGYNTMVLARDAQMVNENEKDNPSRWNNFFQGATIVECDVTDEASLQQAFDRITDNGNRKIDAVISCLASPSGTKRDAYAIDYQATLNCLQAGQAANARHFVLLSAFCCRNPILQLQQAKLKFEAELQQQSNMTYSIVRPTAFFKSVSGQLEGIKGGAPYVLFEDGAVTKCNPIAESELAEYMMDCLLQENKDSRWNRILNIGGPDKPLTNKMLGEQMFRALSGRAGAAHEAIQPRFVYVPIFFFDPIIDTLQFLATTFKSEQLEDAAETARIGKYYAVEDMLTTDPSEKYGKITVQDHYNQIATQGQDPFTPVRATAIIGRAIEAIPAVSFFAFACVPAAYAIAHLPAIAGSDLGDFSMMLSALLSSRQ